VKERALSHLNTLFPSQFPAFPDLQKWLCETTIEFEIRDAIAVISLGRLTDTPSILPLAFYMCCQLDAELIHGVEQDGIREQLSADDIARCISGKANLAEANAGAALRTLLGPRHNNASPCKCSSRLYEFTRMLIFGPVNSLTRCAALDSWNDVLSSLKLCEACGDRLVKAELEERRDIWGRLPAMFGLEDAIDDWPAV